MFVFAAADCFTCIIQAVERSPGVGGFSRTEIDFSPPAADSVARIILTFTPHMVINLICFTSSCRLILFNCAMTVVLIYVASRFYCSVKMFFCLRQDLLPGSELKVFLPGFRGSTSR